MANYKNMKPEVIKEFLSKMFGALATKTGQSVAKDMAKKDPTVGKKLARAAALVKDIEKDLKGISKKEKDEYEKDLLSYLD